MSIWYWVPVPYRHRISRTEFFRYRNWYPLFGISVSVPVKYRILPSNTGTVPYRIFRYWYPVLTNFGTSTGSVWYRYHAHPYSALHVLFSSK
ncbi:hypothetical protein HanRHA438_Chr14g0642091 [Helianthus annuus]|nr:hypothetical protein HanRHA438_Chr14g0642091 [Helianthus annuus]